MIKEEKLKNLQWEFDIFDEDDLNYSLSMREKNDVGSDAYNYYLMKYKLDDKYVKE